MRRPTPSLPVAGTDRPPVASTTRLAAMCSPDVRRTSQRSPSRSSPLTRAPSRTIAPRRLTAASSASRTSFAWFEAGKSLPLSSSSRSGIPRSSSKKRRTLGQRPGAQDLRQGVGRAVGDEVAGIGVRRQDVAPAAAADQDLLAGALAAFQQEHRTRAARSPERSHKTGRASADNHDRFSSKIAHTPARSVRRDVYPPDDMVLACSQSTTR